MAAAELNNSLCCALSHHCCLNVFLLFSLTTGEHSEQKIREVLHLAMEILLHECMGMREKEKQNENECIVSVILVSYFNH